MRILALQLAGILLLLSTCLCVQGYRFYGPYDLIQPRDTRWQRVIKNNDESLGNKQGKFDPLRPPVTDDTDPAYVQDLVKYLWKIGKKK